MCDIHYIISQVDSNSINTFSMQPDDRIFIRLHLDITYRVMTF